MYLTPKYTDSHRYTHGYRAACDTDIEKTFERIRRQQAGEVPELKASVAPIKPRLKAA
jgi:hypothetical protein